MNLQEFKTNLTKIAPWNWFRKEEEQARAGASSVAQNYLSAPLVASPFWQLHREVDRLFEEAFRNFGWFPRLPEQAELARPSWLRPALDIEETSKEYRVTVEVPGVEERDLDVSVDNNVLVIRGEKRQERDRSEGSYHRSERFYGHFQRMLDLPEDADPEAITARFRNGVLSITIGKRQSAQKPKGRTIPIQS
jgi:HSP20 family protein